MVFNRIVDLSKRARRRKKGPITYGFGDEDMQSLRVSEMLAERTFLSDDHFIKMEDGTRFTVEYLERFGLDTPIIFNQMEGMP
jgi:hypothetical protein